MTAPGLPSRAGRVCPQTTPPPCGVDSFPGVEPVNLDALLTGTQAARLVGVSKQLVRKWRVLGHLEPVEPDPPLFRVRDVLTAERQTRRSPQSRRAA